MSLLYTPGQLRDAAGLPAETYRHWKKTLAPLRRARGHSPSFTPGDLVAVAIVRVLTETFGIRVSMLGPVAEPLFARCNEFPWPVLERGVMVIEIVDARVSLRQEQGERLPTAAAIVVPLGNLVSGLSETMLASDLPGEQGSLRFPPIAFVSQGRRS